MSAQMRNDTIAICPRGNISSLRLSQEWTKKKGRITHDKLVHMKTEQGYFFITCLIILFCSRKIHDHSLQGFDWPHKTHPAKPRYEKKHMKRQKLTLELEVSYLFKNVIIFKKCISQETLIQQIPPDATTKSATKWTI